MSDFSAPAADNQFIFSKPSLDGLSPPVKTSESTNLPLKVHRSHEPLISRGFLTLMLLAAPNPPSNLDSPDSNSGLFKSFTKLQLSLFSLALILFFVGSYFSFIGFRYNIAAKTQAAALTNIANKENTPKSSGSSKSPVLSTTPVTVSDLASYSVAPNMPRLITIPKLNVEARILSVGLTSSGDLGTPDNIYDTAWYNQSALPGNPGAMLIVGHVSSWTAHGVFYGIKSLDPGDIIKVERGDGTVLTYTVVKSEIYKSSAVNMQAAITPISNSSPGLNLITCTGDVIPGTSTFNERIIVFASQVSS